MKKLFTLVFILIGGLSFAQVPSYVPTNGLVGWWPFNGNANDESGNGNNGTVNGATLTTDRFGLQNMAYYFSNSKIEIPHASSLGFTQNQGFSVSVWAKKDVGITTTHLMGKRPNGAQDFNWHIADWEGAQFSSTSAPNVFGAISNQPLSTENWSHIVGTYNSGLWKLFINGSLIISNSFSFYYPDVNTPLVFGNSGNWGGFFGSLDDIGIWNRALTECEIQDLYHAQVGFTTVDAGQDQTICRGTEVTLNGAGGNFLSWNNGVVNGVPFAPNQTSSYILTGADSLGCVGADTVLVTVLDNASSTINQTAIDSYTLNGQTYTQSGTYTQVLTAANGCDSTITLNLELDFTGIQTNTLTSLKLYPNPAQDVLHIEGLASKEFEYEVLSIDGKLLQKGKSQGEISVKELRKGNYMLRVGQQQVSFVKQ